MAAARPILLVIGAGPNIGAHVAKSFAADSYQVAVASRKDHKLEGVSHFPVDLVKPETVPELFEKVKAKLGVPSVVVYNAAMFSPDDKADPLTDYSFEKYGDSLAVNTTSVLQALKQAVIGFRQLPAAASKTFIFTGNILNLVTMPGMATFGLTKGATAYVIRNLVESQTYEKEGIKFYYADERTSTGAPVMQSIDGPAAAVEYLRIAQLPTQGPWLYTFAKDEGYKDFEASK